MLIAQITDTHIRALGGRAFQGQVDTSARLRTAVAFLRDLEPRPDLVLATGDLVDDGTDADYAQLLSLLAPLDIPVLPIPGNHDARGPFRAAFPAIAARAPDGFLNYVVEDHPLRLVALDSTVEGATGGDLCALRLDWLARTLAASTRPTLIFMHHPPFDYGIASSRDMRCGGADALHDIVSAQDSVVAILCGHLHRTTAMRWAGTTVSTMSAVAPTIALDIAGGLPVGWIDTPPMLGLHLWKPGTGLLSHTISVDEPTRLQRFRPA